MSEILFPTGIGGDADQWILAVIKASMEFDTVYVRDSSGVTSEYTTDANAQVFVDMKVGSTYYITDSFETGIEYTCNGTEADTPILLMLYYTQSVGYTMLLDTTSGTLDECTDITGGWGTVKGTVSMNNTGIALTGGNAQVKSVSLINMAEYSHLNLDNSTFTSTADNGSLNVILSDSSNTDIKQSTQNDGPYGRQIRMLPLNGENGWKTSSSMHHDWGSIDKSALKITMNAYTCTGQFYNVFLTKPNSFAVGGLSVDEVLTNTTMLTTLLSDKDWVEHILCKKLTGDFMAKAVRSQTFLEALEAAPAECYNLVVSNPHWSKFLNMVGWCPESARVYLYKDGNEYTDITGGWNGYVLNSGSASYERRSNTLYARMNSNDRAGWIATPMISLSNYTYIGAEALSGLEWGCVQMNSSKTVLVDGYEGPRERGSYTSMITPIVSGCTTIFIAGKAQYQYDIQIRKVWLVPRSYPLKEIN